MAFIVNPKHTLGTTAIILLIAAVLSACASPHRSAQKQDGAPGIALNGNTIRDAVPKHEPLSKYGNPDTYVVLGKRYRTLKTSKGFKQKGIASWYGTKFHGNRTSSGEIYNMFAMTAAHKTLPLPTYVEVINLENNRRAIVKVNDRGPFHDKRIIDLSYAAAVKLGVNTTGTAKVEIRAIDPRRHSHNAPPPQRVAAARPAPTPPQATTPPPAPATTDTAMYFQIGAFSNRDSAEDLRQRVSRQIPMPVQITPTSAPATTLYRVRIGPLQSDSEAEKVSALLAMIGVTNANLIIE